LKKDFASADARNRTRTADGVPSRAPRATGPRLSDRPGPSVKNKNEWAFVKSRNELTEQVFSGKVLLSCSYFYEKAKTGSETEEERKNGKEVAAGCYAFF
jgi:hypothetical protein